MKISAQITNEPGGHRVTVQTGETRSPVSIPPKASGFGSSINGGELLMAALATCYCNDLYREAAKHGLRVEGVEVDAEGDFAGEGLPASAIRYRVRVRAGASPQEIEALIRHTDRVAEIQATVRGGCAVSLEGVEAIQV